MMPPRKKVEDDFEDGDEDSEELVNDEPPTIEPYEVLGLEKAATADEIKQAYRKAALKHHPGTSHFSACCLIHFVDLLSLPKSCLLF